MNNQNSIELTTVTNHFTNYSQPTSKTELIWTEEMVIAAFEEAFRIMRKLPTPKVSGYFSTWPEILYTEAEIARMDQKTRQWLPTPESISKLHRTCSWIHYVEGIQERKLIWLRARKTPWKEICQELGFSRTTGNRYWNKAIRRITQQLEGVPLCTKH